MPEAVSPGTPALPDAFIRQYGVLPVTQTDLEDWRKTGQLANCRENLLRQSKASSAWRHEEWKPIRRFTMMPKPKQPSGMKN